MGDIYNAMWKYDEALSTLEHNEFVKVTNYSIKTIPKFTQNERFHSMKYLSACSKISSSDFIILS